MSLSNMYADFKAAKEHTNKIVHPDGRQTVYSTDYRGREFVSLFGRNGSFQGTYPLNRPKPQPLPHAPR